MGAFSHFIGGPKCGLDGGEDHLNVAAFFHEQRQHPPARSPAKG